MPGPQHAPRRRPLRHRKPLRHWKKDVPAGITLGVESVPDGLAGGLLAGVNPIYGLYGYMVGTFFGALGTSSAFMAVQATGAMAVVVADIPETQGEGGETALFTVALLTGIIMLALGAAGLGRVVRWVPNSVLVGFVNAVAVTIVLSQLDDITGYDGVGATRLHEALDTILHVGSWSLSALGVGLSTIVLIVLLEKTRLGALGMVVAVILGSLLAIPFDAVPVLADIATVPAGLPGITLPDLSLVGSLLVPAASLAFVGLVQGAAISASTPNPDGEYPDPSGDFRGQGVANIASGLLSGMPVGGSMSATAIVTRAGARSRLALIVAGLTMAFVVVVLSDAVGQVAMPALAGLLMVVGVRSLKLSAAGSVLRTGGVQATAMLVTFVLTILIPLQYAVLVGVGTSLILFVVKQSNKVTLRRWVPHADGSFTEEDLPGTLGRHDVVVIRPYGSLFFAATPIAEAQLPTVGPTTDRCAVLLNLRGKEELGSTFINLLERYGERLAGADSRLYLVGVSADLAHQLERTGTLDQLGPDRVHVTTSTLRESTLRAVHDARAWQDDDR
ncbi:SulP family sulfate permease [Sediminihabitans luteus]|uniref:SulP family sulfate permease n=1 Tax=Sediminihabitans luteus TaxID=1138585 RepID=A0A2M9CDI7_9CELL|nr:SulP family inorganic anion transporter [Sediminihabitans luteus]PJJ69938.1 SulP family sulfate permease [Sediminihabitans luteus]GII99258.1 sodium-independent anion transporter [Sediminihabitans luteus]